MKACHLYQTVAKSLGSESITEVLTNPSDALAVAVYSWAVESGLNESDGEAIGSQWNQGSPNYYGFDLKGSNINLSISRVGNEMVVNALDTEHPDVHPSCPLSVHKYVNISFFSRLDSEDVHDMYKSEEVMEEFTQRLNDKILHKLRPETQKHASSLDEETSSRPNSKSERDERDSKPEDAQSRDSLVNQHRTLLSQTESTDSRGNSPSNNPYPVPVPPVSVRGTDSPARNTPPGFEDDYEILQRPGNSNRNQQPFVPIGQGDLYPPEIGPYPRLEPIIGLGEGRGGMYPSSDDPLFRGRNGNETGRPPGVPRGARWDPFGPPGGGPNSNGSSGFNRFI